MGKTKVDPNWRACGDKNLSKRSNLKHGAWKWFDHIYKSNFVLLCCPREDVVKALRTVVQRKPAKVLEDGGLGDVGGGIAGRFVGAHHDEHGTLAAIWLRPDAGAGVMSHEALHAVFYVLDNKGLRLCDDSEEAFTYYLQWLMAEIANRTVR